jgi:hypothetical protein
MQKSAMAFPEITPLKIYPVSNLVNSPKTDDPRCIQPVRIDRDFFERSGGVMSDRKWVFILELLRGRIDS